MLPSMTPIIEKLSDYLPAITSISPITIAGIGVTALAGLLYLFMRIPELLLVMLTGILYAAAPLLPRII
jgi:hypothetical protein